MDDIWFYFIIPALTIDFELSALKHLAPIDENSTNIARDHRTTRDDIQVSSAVLIDVKKNDRSEISESKVYPPTRHIFRLIKWKRLA